MLGLPMAKSGYELQTTCTGNSYHSPLYAIHCFVCKMFRIPSVVVPIIYAPLQLFKTASSILFILQFTMRFFPKGNNEKLGYLD